MKKLLILAAACALSLPGLASAANITGLWKVTVNAGDMMFHSNCDLKQSGSAITGTCVSTDAPPGGGGDAPKPSAVTGTVDGSTVKFAHDVSFGDMTMHLDYTGALASDTAMAGKISVADMQIDFTATKS